MASNSLRQVSLICSGHTRPVVDLTFAQRPSGDVLLISACKDGRPMLRDGVTGDWIGTFEGHKGAVWSVCMDGNGQLAATGSADFTAKLWDTADGKERLSVAHNHIVRAVDLAPNGSQLFTGNLDKKIRCFDVTAIADSVVEDTSALQTLEGHSAAVKYVRLLPDGRRLVSVGDDRTVRVWDPAAAEGGGLIKTIELPVQPYSLEITPDGERFVMALGNKVQVWSTKTYEMIKVLTLPCPMFAASLHCDEKFVVCGGHDSRMYKVDFETGAELESFRGHFGPVHCCAFSPDGQLYASGSEDGTVRLWQTIVGTTYGLWKYVEGSGSSSSSNNNNNTTTNNNDNNNNTNNDNNIPSSTNDASNNNGSGSSSSNSNSTSAASAPLAATVTSAQSEVELEVKPSVVAATVVADSPHPDPVPSVTAVENTDAAAEAAASGAGDGQSVAEAKPPPSESAESQVQSSAGVVVAAAAAAAEAPTTVTAEDPSPTAVADDETPVTPVGGEKALEERSAAAATAVELPPATEAGESAAQIAGEAEAELAESRSQKKVETPQVSERSTEAAGKSKVEGESSSSALLSSQSPSSLVTESIPAAQAASTAAATETTEGDKVAEVTTPAEPAAAAAATSDVPTTNSRHSSPAAAGDTVTPTAPAP